MPARKFGPNLIADNDPVRWFHRLERAVREQDYPLATIARDELRRLGWTVEPAQNRPPVHSRNGRQEPAGVAS
jgi:hypothetical protein